MVVKDETPCSLVSAYRPFGGAYYIGLQIKGHYLL